MTRHYTIGEDGELVRCAAPLVTHLGDCEPEPSDAASHLVGACPVRRQQVIHVDHLWEHKTGRIYSCTGYPEDPR